MSTLSAVVRLLTGRQDRPMVEWWSYFGSFGDDIFDDDDIDAA